MSEIKVDTLTGKTTAGDITVTSEGGAATQSLQQGLAKAWVNFNGTGTIATRGSLNVSGLLDDGTGDYTISFSNTMANVNYSAAGAVNQNETTALLDFSLQGTQAVGSVKVAAHITNGFTRYDSQIVCTSIHGDLA